MIKQIVLDIFLEISSKTYTNRKHLSGGRICVHHCNVATTIDATAMVLSHFACLLIRKKNTVYLVPQTRKLTYNKTSRRMKMKAA
jgi:hypothetical protein